MDQLTFFAAVLALLATPGPTNTLLATSGAEAGLRRSLPLLGAELGGYLLAIGALRVLVGPMMAVHPVFAAGLQAAIALYLLHLAWTLWRRGTGPIGGAVTFPRVFLTTLLNPKAIIFAFTLLPLQADAAALPKRLALLAAQIIAVGFGWILLGAQFHGKFRQPGATRVGYRLSAMVLVSLAGAIGGRLLSLA